MPLRNDMIQRYSVKVPEEIDTAAETNADTYVDVRGKGKNMVMVVHAGLTSLKTAVCQLTCATDASGTSKADVTGKTLTLTGGTSKMGEIEFAPTDLDLTNLKYFVGVDITTNQNGDDIEAHLACVPDFLEGSSNPTN
jgi:hypothetical protein